MSEPAKIGPIVPRPGVPLYKDVRDVMVDAIRTGVFHPGDRLPNTKQLSDQLSVSLVTTHRAMQELVASGYLERTQGRGTFVRDFADDIARRLKIGIVLNPSASMAEFYYSQILEGMCQACRTRDIELLMLRPQERAEMGVQGYIGLNLSPEMLQLVYKLSRKQVPVVSVGEPSRIKQVSTIDVDNVNLAMRAVEHVYELGHRRIGYLGASNDLTYNRDRHEGFVQACQRLGVPESEMTTIIAEHWQLGGEEKISLGERLKREDRPTAIVTGGYYLALDTYAVTSTIGMAIPDDLSVVGVDDPTSAAYLSPALTTMQQPLVELGQTAVAAIESAAASPDKYAEDCILRPELIVRGSTAAISDA